MNRPRKPERVHDDAQWHRLFGVDVTAITIGELLNAVEFSIDEQEDLTVFTQNLHGAYLQARSPEMRAAYDVCDLAYIDGMPFVWHGDLLGADFSREHRTTYLDWYERFYGMASKLGWKVYYLGGTEESFKISSDALLQQFPGLDFKGRDGYFDVHGSENSEVLEDINDFRPDVLIVGMGMPRQEQWVADNRPLLDARTIVTVGAGNDYIAGIIATPPRWMGRFGLEWLYRLGTEPHRLWHRYLVEPIFLLPIFVRELIRVRLLGNSSTIEHPGGEQNGPADEALHS